MQQYMKANAKLTTYNIYVDYGHGVKNKRLYLLSRQNIRTLTQISGVHVCKMAAQSKAQVCGCLPTEIVGSNPTGGMDICLL